MPIMLECPHCSSCPTITEWNQAPGIRDEPIPEFETTDEWEAYTMQYSGRIDCPVCGEVAIYEDMTPV